jgi:hypothetical protein
MLVDKQDNASIAINNNLIDYFYSTVMTLIACDSPLALVTFALAVACS